MIVRDLHIVGVVIAPDKTDPVLIINAKVARETADHDLNTNVIRS
jgi:hypothetical protein